MVRLLLPAAFLAVLISGSWTPLVQARAAQSTASETISDGVYTGVQADRGKAQYDASCGRCHGTDLSGANARPLAGETFVRYWSGLTLDELFDRAQTMPPNAAVLGDAAYLDILTYVLAVNGFPAGSDELRADELGRILIEGRDGPQPPPNFALVQLVGCLTQGPDGAWVVTNASEPVRTRDPEASADGQRREAQVMALGTERFRLLYVYPSPDAYEGQTVEAKGFLIRGSGSTDSVNVTALQSLGPRCGE